MMRIVRRDVIAFAFGLLALLGLMLAISVSFRNHVRRLDPEVLGVVRGQP